MVKVQCAMSFYEFVKFSFLLRQDIAILYATLANNKTAVRIFFAYCVSVLRDKNGIGTRLDKAKIRDLGLVV